jgi:hypothetical protein
MNKYILADMAIDRLTKEIGMVAKPFPEEIKTLETDHPSGRIRFEHALYQAEKLKKISIGKRDLGESGTGTVVMLISDDEYDLPFILLDLAIDFSKKGRISAGFGLRLLVKDEESIRKYIDPFLEWHKAMGSIPGESVSLDVGGFLKANPPSLGHLHSITNDYLDEVLKYTEQFFDIFLDIYRKAEPVKDAQRRIKMDAFRSEYNQRIFGDDYSGKVLIKTFGQQTAALFYDYFVYL